MPALAGERVKSASLRIGAMLGCGCRAEAPKPVIRRGDWKVLAVCALVIFLVALLLRMDRLGSLAEPISHWEGDPRAYWDLGSKLYFAEEFENEWRAWRPPGYPAFLSCIFLISPFHVRLVFVIQAILDSLTACLLSLIVFSVTRSALLGFLSGAWHALSGPAITLSNTLWSESLYLFALASATAATLALLLGRNPSTRTAGAISSGVLCGLVTYIKPQILFYMAPAVVLFLLVHRRQLKQAIVLSLLVSVGYCVVLAPWTIRNYMLFDAVVPVTTNSGINLLLANHPLSNGKYTPLPQEVNRILNKLPELEKDRKAREMAMEYIRADPRAYREKVLYRAKICLFLAESKSWLQVWHEIEAPRAISTRWSITPGPALGRIAILSLLVLGCHFFWCLWRRLNISGEDVARMYFFSFAVFCLLVNSAVLVDSRIAVSFVPIYIVCIAASVHLLLPVLARIVRHIWKRNAMVVALGWIVASGLGCGNSGVVSHEKREAAKATRQIHATALFPNEVMLLVSEKDRGGVMPGGPGIEAVYVVGQDDAYVRALTNRREGFFATSSTLPHVPAFSTASEVFRQQKVRQQVIISHDKKSDKDEGIKHTIRENYANRFRLHSISLSDTHLVTGETIFVDFECEVLAEVMPGEHFGIFVHIDHRGEPPHRINLYRGISGIVPGREAGDRFTASIFAKIGEDVPAGEYSLNYGIYNPRTMENLEFLPSSIYRVSIMGADRLSRDYRRVEGGEGMEVWVRELRPVYSPGEKFRARVAVATPELEAGGLTLSIVDERGGVLHSVSPESPRPRGTHWAFAEVLFPLPQTLPHGRYRAVLTKGGLSIPVSEFRVIAPPSWQAAALYARTSPAGGWPLPPEFFQRRLVVQGTVSAWYSAEEAPRKLPGFDSSHLLAGRNLLLIGQNQVLMAQNAELTADQRVFGAGVSYTVDVIYQDKASLVVERVD